MGRPPIEWPIPAYVAEFRERVVLTFRVPGPLLARLVPAPLAPQLVGGRSVVCLALSSGRCLKPLGGASCLVSDFHTAELYTPVRWQGACREALLGSLLLGFRTDSHSLARLLRKGVQMPAETGTHSQGGEGKEYLISLGADLELRLVREGDEAPWPTDSVFASAEAAEIHVLHPQSHFVPESGGRAVHEVPVHEYARKTTPVALHGCRAPLVERWLGADAHELTVDHVMFRKRCTHTWSLPPERIPVAPRTAAPVRLAVAA